MNVGRCRHCGYRPVAYDAPECPQCAGHDPNKHPRTQLGERLNLWILLASVPIGSIVGAVLARGNPEQMIGGAFFGFLGGAVVGATLGKAVNDYCTPK